MPTPPDAPALTPASVAYIAGADVAFSALLLPMLVACYEGIPAWTWEPFAFILCLAWGSALVLRTPRPPHAGRRFRVLAGILLLSAASRLLYCHLGTSLLLPELRVTGILTATALLCSSLFPRSSGLLLFCCALGFACCIPADYLSCRVFFGHMLPNRDAWLLSAALFLLAAPLSLLLRHRHTTLRLQSEK